MQAILNARHFSGPGKHAIGLSVHHAVPVEVCPGSPSGHFPWPGGEHQEFYPGRAGIIPRVHRIATHGATTAPQTYYLHNNEDEGKYYHQLSLTLS